MWARVHNFAIKTKRAARHSVTGGRRQPLRNLIYALKKIRD